MATKKKEKSVTKLQVNESPEITKTKVEGGILGILFGIGDNASKSITAIVIIFLITIGSVYMIFKDGDLAVWNIFLPVITLALGYIFGKATSK